MVTLSDKELFAIVDNGMMLMAWCYYKIVFLFLSTSHCKSLSLYVAIRFCMHAEYRHKQKMQIYINSFQDITHFQYPCFDHQINKCTHKCRQLKYCLAVSEGHALKSMLINILGLICSIDHNDCGFN